MEYALIYEGVNEMKYLGKISHWKAMEELAAERKKSEVETSGNVGVNLCIITQEK